MASLQQTSISLQSNPLSSSQLPRALPSLNLSFSATFPSLKLTTTRPFHGGAKMSASAASSYATALADVAKTNDTLEATSSDVEKVEKIFTDPTVTDFFSNPTIDLIKKRQVLDEIVKSSEIQPHTANFLNILVDAKRIDIIKEIVKEFEIVYNMLTDTELAVVSSVVPLESQHLAQIAKQVQKLTGAKNVRIKTTIEPSLVAGFTIRYGKSGSKLIDMSVKKQLEEIAAQLDLSDIQLAEVLLFGAGDDIVVDEKMQITVAFNHFGKGLVQRLPRVRTGFFHVIKNDYTHWIIYAIGGSSHPTIISQDNQFAPENTNANKEVTKRDYTNDEWKKWSWTSQGDVFENGTFFTPSGDPKGSKKFGPNLMVLFQPGRMVPMLTKNSGTLSCQPGKAC